MGPSGRDARLVLAKPRGLASSAQRAIGCLQHCTPLFALPSNDGYCRVFCGQFFLGSCALASGVESAYEGGNAAHVLHPTGLLFLLSRRTGRCGPDCTAMVRPERNQLWPGSCLAVHSSPSWLECTHLVSCRKNGADSQAVSIQLQTVFPRDVPCLCCGEPGHSLSGQLQYHRALAPSRRGQAHWLRFRRQAIYELPLASACGSAVVLLSLADAGKDTDSDPPGRDCWRRTAFARSPDTRVVLFSVVLGPAAVILLGLPLLELQSWAPYYSFYLNSIGGEKQNIARYFAMDEVSEFDTREVAQKVCPFAPAAATVATARPMSMGYYLQACGRADLQIVPLYDTHYAPRDGDLIVLEPSRRFFETQRFFDALGNSGMPHSEIRVGPVLASTIFLFDPSVPRPSSGKEEVPLAQLRGAPSRFDK